MRIFCLFIFVFFSCNNKQSYIPKPRAYPKIDFPISTFYDTLNTKDCPLVLVYPEYFIYKQQVDIHDTKSQNTCWFNLHFDKWKADVYFTYHEINKEVTFQNLVDDAFSMAHEHTVKAEYISEKRIATENGVGGILFDFDGPSASPLQFFATDTVNHFLRGSLYFDSKVVPDSLQPMINYLKVDIVNIIESIRWQ